MTQSCVENWFSPLKKGELHWNYKDKTEGQVYVWPFKMLLSIHSRRSLNFLSFCGFVFTLITALLTELYRFNPKPAPTLISGSQRMDRIKYMTTSRGSFSMPRRTAFNIEQICCFLKQIDKLLIIRFIHKKRSPPFGHGSSHGASHSDSLFSTDATWFKYNRADKGQS